MLARLVAAGKLPPVSERIPKEPVVVSAKEIGRYGGTWRTVTKGRTDYSHFVRCFGYEPWVRWDETWTGDVLPGVMSRFEASPDARSFTFWIREGLKWSDGHPVTTKDIETYFALLNNKELYPGGPGMLLYNDKPAKVTIVDERQFRIEFPDPYGLFLKKRAVPNTEYIDEIVPAHYVGKYLLPENQEFVHAEMKRLGLKDYPALIKHVLDWRDNPDLPTLYQFVVKKPISADSTVLFERNPYYWKVDAAGNQLPYLDYFSAEVHEDTNTMVLKALNGELDWQDRHINTFANKAVLVDGQQRGNYTVFQTKPTQMNNHTFQLNLVHKDPVLRSIFQDKRFRMALSYAINRQEVIDTIYVGQGEPAQSAPLKGSPYYDEEMATQYTEYDVAKANSLLDEVGLKRGPNGQRLRPDGKRLTFTVEVPNNQVPQGSDYAEMLSKYFAAVGIDMQVKILDRALFYERKKANLHDAIMFGGDEGVAVVLEPRYSMAFSEESGWAVPWAQWWTSGGKLGESPIEPVRQQQALYDRLQRTGDPKQQEAIMKEILKIAKENFWVIGLSTRAPEYGIVRNDFHNTPSEPMWNAWLWPHPAPVNTCTWFTTRSS